MAWLPRKRLPPPSRDLLRTHRFFGSSCCMGYQRQFCTILVSRGISTSSHPRPILDTFATSALVFDVLALFSISCFHGSSFFTTPFSDWILPPRVWTNKRGEAA